MNVASWLARAGKTHGKRPAVARGDRVLLDYAGLAERAGQLAGGLARAGLAPGDRVAIVSANHPAYVEALYGIWHGRFVAVPVNAKLHAAEIAYILDQSGARLCLCGDALAGDVAAQNVAGAPRIVAFDSSDYAELFAHDPAPLTDAAGDDLAWLFYTSGTTGKPKGAMLTHGNLVAMSLSYLADVDRVAPGDAILHAAPMSHGSGLYIVPQVLKAAVNVVPDSGGFEPAEVFELLGKWKGTTMFAAPTMVKRLIEHKGGDAANLKSLVYGGGPMYVEDAVAALDRFGNRLVQIYGQGESPMTITVLTRDDIANRDHPRWRQRLASVGVAQSAVEVRVADADDNEVAPGEVGEVLVRGAAVMAGYWNDAAATAETLNGGWLHTGDLGSMDADGYLSLKDRSKDVIITGGSNVYPREVEEVLLRHDKVREVAVVGRPDPEWGEAVVAYVVGDAAPEALDALCLNAIARFKRPKDYVFVDALPKNNYGKVLKTALRERHAKAPTSS